jgi:hypothetical protein
MNTTDRSPRVNCSISLPYAVRESARQAAFDDNRSLSGLITRLLQRHLAAEGYLPESRPPAAPSSEAP